MADKDMQQYENIPEIHDINDITAYQKISDVAEPPPSMSLNRSNALRALNSDLLEQSTFCSIPNVDLSILTKYLRPKLEIVETDEKWHWDEVFTEVTSDLEQAVKTVERNPK